jgi:hypothetical protein
VNVELDRPAFALPEAEAGVMRSEPEIDGVIVTAGHQLLRRWSKPQTRPEVYVLKTKSAGDV